MSIDKRGLKATFVTKASDKAQELKNIPATLRPAPHPAHCRKEFAAACERQGQPCVNDLETVVMAASSVKCGRDERVERLLFALLTGRRPLTSRFRIELQMLIDRRARCREVAQRKRLNAEEEEYEREEHAHARHGRRPRRHEWMMPAPSPRKGWGLEIA